MIHLSVPLSGHNGTDPPKAGDKMIVIIQFFGDPPTTPPGWGRVPELDVAVVNQLQLAYSRIFQHGDPDAVVFSGLSDSSVPSGWALKVGTL